MKTQKTTPAQTVAMPRLVSRRWYCPLCGLEHKDSNGYTNPRASRCRGKLRVEVTAEHIIKGARDMWWNPIVQAMTGLGFQSGEVFAWVPAKTNEWSGIWMPDWNHHAGKLPLAARDWLLNWLRDWPVEPFEFVLQLGEPVVLDVAPPRPKPDEEESAEDDGEVMEDESEGDQLEMTL